jgi:hypothetical protein
LKQWGAAQLTPCERGSEPAARVRAPGAGAEAEVCEGLPLRATAAIFEKKGGNDLAVTGYWSFQKNCALALGQEGLYLLCEFQQGLDEYSLVQPILNVKAVKNCIILR